MQRTFLLGAAALALSGCGSGLHVATGGSSTAAVAVSNGPQLGYAWNAQDETLRPILGVPGSSQVGESVVPAGAYVGGAASSAAGIALLIGTDHQLYRMSLPSGTPAQVGASVGAGSRIRFSPSGTAALVYVPGGTSAELLSNLSSTSTLRAISVASPIVDGAASDAGTAVAILQGAGSATVDLLPASGAAQPLASLGGAGGLSFAGTSEDLVVADAAKNSLTLIRSASTSATAVQLASGGLLKAPVAVGASLNGRWIAVANSGESSVVRVDLTAGTAPQRVLCPAQPAIAAALAGGSVFRFNELGSAPAWISDVSAATPTMLFIPALPSAATAATTLLAQAAASPAK